MLRWGRHNLETWVSDGRSASHLALMHNFADANSEELACLYKGKFRHHGNTLADKGMDRWYVLCDGGSGAPMRRLRPLVMS